MSLIDFIRLENYLSEELGIKVTKDWKAHPEGGSRSSKREFLDYVEDIRNEDRVIHEYFGIDLRIIWKTVKEEIPNLGPLFEKILKDFEKSEF